jgi:hypothetical protein
MENLVKNHDNVKEFNMQMAYKRYLKGLEDPSKGALNIFAYTGKNQLIIAEMFRITKIHNTESQKKIFFNLEQNDFDIDMEFSDTMQEILAKTIWDCFSDITKNMSTFDKKRYIRGLFYFACKNNIHAVYSFIHGTSSLETRDFVKTWHSTITNSFSELFEEGEGAGINLRHFSSQTLPKLIQLDNMEKIQKSVENFVLKYNLKHKAEMIFDFIMDTKLQIENDADSNYKRIYNEHKNFFHELVEDVREVVSASLFANKLGEEVNKLTI